MNVTAYRPKKNIKNKLTTGDPIGGGLRGDIMSNYDLQKFKLYNDKNQREKLGIKAKYKQPQYKRMKTNLPIMLEK